MKRTQQHSAGLCAESAGVVLVLGASRNREGEAYEDSVSQSSKIRWQAAVQRRYLKLKICREGRGEAALEKRASASGKYLRAIVRDVGE